MAVEQWLDGGTGRVRSRHGIELISSWWCPKQAALLCQVEEKRRRREREVAAKREEDEADRARVLKALAEDRAAFRGRYTPQTKTNKNQKKKHVILYVLIAPLRASK